MRVSERLGGSLCLHLLQESWTFTSWVGSQGLSAHSLREAQTLARSLELLVFQFGAAILQSMAVEVMVRRLMALSLASRMGSWRMASILEEVPNQDALSALPEDLLKSLQDRLRIEAKIEQLTKDPSKEKK